MSRIVAVAVVVAGLWTQLWAGVVKVGPEFQVNAYTFSDQESPSVAVDGSGDFVVAWRSWAQDGSSYGIFARRFDSSGVPQGLEFQVNTYTTGSQSRPSVTTDWVGNFVVVWESYDGSYYGGFGQQFDRAGVPRDTEFRVNTYTEDYQSYPSVAAVASGGFVVVWQSYDQDGSDYGIFGQRFDSAGVPQGSEFQVNIHTTNSQRWPSLAVDAAGNIVVAWQSFGQDGSLGGIFARRFDGAGVPQGSEFQVNTYTTDQQYYPWVAAEPAGNFVVVWQSYGQDGSGHGIFGQRFDSAGVPQGSEFQVNTYTTISQGFPSVAMDASGDFVVVWESWGQDGSEGGIFGRRFDSAGIPQGDEFQVNTYTTGLQDRPSIALDAGGDFVVAWTSHGQDGSHYGIFGQRFYGRSPEVTAPLPTDTLDCSDPRLVRPTLTWDDDRYDRFRAFIGWDPAFGTGRQVTSGDTLLRATSWTPSAKKWRKACANAAAINPSSPVLYLKVLGVDRDLPKSNPARKRYSPVVQVNVQP